MKRKFTLVPLLCGVVICAACKDKPAPATSASSGDAPAQATPDTPPAEPVEPIKPSATAAKRAEQLGFAKRLPKSVTHYEAMFNGRKAFDRLMASGLGEFIIDRMEAEDLDLDELLGNEQFAAQIATYSEEYFAAYGEGTEKSYRLAYQLLQRMAYYGAKTGVFALDGFMREGDDFEMEDPEVIFDGPLKGVEKDAIKLLTDFEMPAIYQGAKVTDPEARELVAAQMEEFASLILNEMADAAEEITIKREGVEFTGIKIVGSKLAEMIDEEKVENLKKVFKISDIEAFKKELATKNAIFVSGTIGEYVLSFIGKSEEDFKLVDDIEQSACANEKMVFVDKYLDKEILFAGFSDGDFINNVGNVEGVLFKILGSAAQGASDGMGDATSLGDTRDIEALLEDIKDQGKKISGMFRATDAGFIAYMEDGLKMEVFGGSNMPHLDLKKTHTLGSMGESSDTLLFANWTANKAYNKRMFDYIDSLGETSYMVAKRIAARGEEDDDLAEFQEQLKMFDAKFRDNTLAIWKSLRGDFIDGLGSESAIIVDINGSMPKIPNTPSAVVKEGKVPRIALVSRVADRDKLKASWKTINENIEKILATASEMKGRDIPMQEPMSSDKDGLKTWYISFPFITNDFVPSVSVSDELFFASTSKNFSEGLASKFETGGGEARNGAWLRVDYKVLARFAKQWHELIEKNADDLDPHGNIAENKELIDKAFEAFGSLDELTVHTRNEGGRTRISGHLKAN